jgi:aryl-alcohol dehydrogenase
MRITAAVAWQPGQPFTVETVDIEEPRADEVLVRVIASGLSHTDLLAREQILPVLLPAVLGREAAGVVERVGAAVTKLVPGDHVVLTFRTGEVQPSTTNGAPFYGEDVFALNFSGLRPDGSSPLRRGGERVAGAFFGQSSFATYALATEANAVKVSKDVGFPVLATFGGDVQAGAGAVINTLHPRPACSIAVFGVGAVGLGAIMAARLAGCHPIVAVDVKASRLELAEALGATYSFDPDGIEPVEAIRRATAGGAEFSIETTGDRRAFSQALACLSLRGVCALAATPTPELEVALNVAQLAGRSLRSCIFGDGVPQVLVPRLIELHKQGRFPVDQILREYPLAHVNEAAGDVSSGIAVKPILMMP